MAILYTIGHSTRSLGELIEALQAHGIKTLVDIRAFPMSRRHPHFNRENLEQELPKVGIEYVWQKDLGGHRKKQLENSPNTALRNDSFRNYADYMLTPQFQTAAAEVRQLAERQRTAIMCAERVWFHCHRMMVSDYYTAHGDTVEHIDATGPTRRHTLMKEAHMVDGKLLYNAGQLF
ncbi:MAG TPA: DUF488 domain-containing protein [Terriglobales bacterium]|nr:DUF488 domain-containing protein [Terriglobales bacterium]